MLVDGGSVAALLSPGDLAFTGAGIFNASSNTPTFVLNAGAGSIFAGDNAEARKAKNVSVEMIKGL